VDDPAEAVRLVGLLADDDRRAVVAALVLGAATVDDIRAETGLSTRAVVTSLHRLVDGDLVVTAADGHYHLLGEAFRLAARAAAPEIAADDAGIDAPPDAARVLRAFVHDGRLTSVPAARSKRLVVLDLIAQDFEPGEQYGEARVNLMLGRWHDDHAALRRYLVDEDFLAREGGVYWRSGGSVPT
jgi:hypothetical protein